MGVCTITVVRGRGGTDIKNRGNNCASIRICFSFLLCERDTGCLIQQFQIMQQRHMRLCIYIVFPKDRDIRIVKVVRLVVRSEGSNNLLCFYAFTTVMKSPTTILLCMLQCSRIFWLYCLFRNIFGFIFWVYYLFRNIFGCTICFVTYLGVLSIS